MRDNAPLHTGCALRVLREMIKPLSTYCPFLVSMATLIKCFFSHISGMPFTSFPLPHSPQKEGTPKHFPGAEIMSWKCFPVSFLLGMYCYCTRVGLSSMRVTEQVVAAVWLQQGASL